MFCYACSKFGTKFLHLILRNEIQVHSFRESAKNHVRTNHINSYTKEVEESLDIMNPAGLKVKESSRLLKVVFSARNWIYDYHHPVTSCSLCSSQDTQLTKVTFLVDFGQNSQFLQRSLWDPVLIFVLIFVIKICEMVNLENPNGLAWFLYLTSIFIGIVCAKSSIAIDDRIPYDYNLALQELQRQSTKSEDEAKNQNGQENQIVMNYVVQQRINLESANKIAKIYQFFEFLAMEISALVFSIFSLIIISQWPSSVCHKVEFATTSTTTSSQPPTQEYNYSSSSITWGF